MLYIFQPSHFICTKRYLEKMVLRLFSEPQPIFSFSGQTSVNIHHGIWWSFNSCFCFLPSLIPPSLFYFNKAYLFSPCLFFFATSHQQAPLCRRAPALPVQDEFPATTAVDRSSSRARPQHPRESRQPLLSAQAELRWRQHQLPLRYTLSNVIQYSMATISSGQCVVDIKAEVTCPSIKAGR